MDHYRELIRARGAGEPVAYILGRAYFHDLTLRVNGSVLIPRPETEHVVEAALAFLKAGEWEQPPRVLDLGTGSGAIAISLAAGFPDTGVTAADSSPDALSLARENARTEGLDARIEFVQSDMFQDLDPTETYDLIVSNPPYISDEEWETLPRDVREYEPQHALRGGSDGLDYYRVLAAESWQHLKPGGMLIVEIGHDQGTPVRGLLAEAGGYGEVRVIKDYAGHDRVVTAGRL